MKRIMTKLITAALSAAIALSSAAPLGVFAEPNNTEATQTNDTVLYTGEEVTPPVSISDEGVQLQNGVDYDLTYENNVNVGTATVIVTFKGNYSGERRVNFNITARHLTNDDVTLSEIDKQIYTGTAIEAKPAITAGGVTLVENTDYTLSYTNNIGIGTVTVDVTFIGNYSGSVNTAFEIIPNEFSDADIESGALTVTGIESQTYTGRAITPEPSIKYGDVTLVKDKDYTLSYENNINVGTATVTVNFKDAYKGSVNISFSILPKSTADESGITINAIPDQTYTGNPITPEVIIIDISK